MEFEDSSGSSFDDVFGTASPAIRGIGEALRALIRKLDPTVVETAYGGWKSVTYGFGSARGSEAYAYLMPFSGHVNVGFENGATLPDPDSLLEGSGKKMRHVKVRSLGAVDDPRLAALLTAAWEERRRALGR